MNVLEQLKSKLENEIPKVSQKGLFQKNMLIVKYWNGSKNWRMKIKMNKYYELHYPYYALIQEENEKEAIRAYVENVANYNENLLSNELREVSRDRALVKFTRFFNKDYPQSDILNEFNNQDNIILLIDGALS